jgi:site-specific recombinase XerC
MFSPAKAIQELAGHANISTTMRYMHLSPGALDQAVALLDSRPVRANIVPTDSGRSRNA